MRLFASGEDWAPPWVASRLRGQHVRPRLRRREAPADLGRLRLERPARHLSRSCSRTPGSPPTPGCGSSTCQARSPGPSTTTRPSTPPSTPATSTRRRTSPGTRTHGPTWRRSSGRTPTSSSSPARTTRGAPSARTTTCSPPQAVDAGIGIRNGITEEFNFHLNEAPAYGSHVQPDGHLVVDETLPVHDGTRVVATENECFTDCGFTSKDPEYVVRQANLKALQLRMNWVYVVPGPSDMVQYAPHWDWVRLSLGQTAATSADAWADLRDAEDTYWNAGSGEGDGPFTSRAAWRDRPFVRNLERWLVQVDVPGARRAPHQSRRAPRRPDTGERDGVRGPAHVRRRRRPGSRLPGGPGVPGGGAARRRREGHLPRPGERWLHGGRTGLDQHCRAPPRRRPVEDRDRSPPARGASTSRSRPRPTCASS